MKYLLFPDYYKQGHQSVYLSARDLCKLWKVDPLDCDVWKPNHSYPASMIMLTGRLDMDYDLTKQINRHANQKTNGVLGT